MPNPRCKPPRCNLPGPNLPGANPMVAQRAPLRPHRVVWQRVSPLLEMFLADPAVTSMGGSFSYQVSFFGGGGVRRSPAISVGKILIVSWTLHRRSSESAEKEEKDKEGQIREIFKNGELPKRTNKDNLGQTSRNWGPPLCLPALENVRQFFGTTSLARFQLKYGCAPKGKRFSKNGAR